ncbi:valine--tRNA ligase [Actinomycetes bacterium]|nr:valine--tRNA ligase [Actinomycetes bacterium]
MTESARYPRVPEKPALDGVEGKWGNSWVQNKTFAFDKTAAKENVYSIDTPPPTVSGSLHVGHVFSYTHTDLIARYQRMTGKKVFYPIGWDDNGLPTERRVQNYFGVRCEPTLPFDANFVAPNEPSEKQIPISRKNFVELCEKLTLEDEKVFESLFQTLGLSIDWNYTYQTIDKRARTVSQRAFLRNLKRGEAYQAEAPTLWDVTFRTAVAQAELEDRERPGAFHKIGFKKQNGENVYIETTRPELLPSCVALVANLDDDRYKELFGKTVTTPLFGVEVPVVAHQLADPEKGSGIAMICTFGDLTDVIWWREFDLPTRGLIGWDGRIVAENPDWLTTESAKQTFEKIVGKTSHTAREVLVAELKASGDLVGEPKPITHAVKFFEKGDKPLEIVTTRQWYIRNGGRDQELRTKLLKRGSELKWHPEYMKVRYENWVEGLNGDWLISRQRFFGVPLPLWYKLDADGNPDYDQIIVPDEKQLPIDPQSEAPVGFDESQRNKPNGFIGDPDVMDTWATSSLTPQIAASWELDNDLFNRVFPMDLRPQSHEIIRTWLFSTVVRSHLEEDSLPWKNASISGWILDPDRKKMSKSKGNVVTPIDLLEEYGSDAVRYWAAMGRPGTDTAFDTGQMKIGKRLAIKLLNASKFSLSLNATLNSADVTQAVDHALLNKLAQVVETATTSFEKYDYTRALEVAETFFWAFTDDYVELVKERTYGNQGEAAANSARAALGITTHTLLKLFAPFIPFVTEEVWSWWQEGSIHLQSWPKSTEIITNNEVGIDPLNNVTWILSEVRKVKTENKQSMKAEVKTLEIWAKAEVIEQVKDAQKDLIAAGNIKDLKLNVTDSEIKVKVELA